MAAPLVGTGRVVGHFRLEVTAAGTPQPLSEAGIVRISAGEPTAVVLQAAPDNTDDITIGSNATVVNTEASRDGLTLAARDIIILGVAGLRNLYVDADVSGEAVTGLLLAQMLSADVVAEALGAEITVADIEGGRRFYVKRGVQTAKFDLRGKEIHWVSIQSPGGGWLDDAVEFVKTVAPEHGVKGVFASPGSERSKTALKHRGFKQDGNKLRLRV